MKKFICICMISVLVLCGCSKSETPAVLSEEDIVGYSGKMGQSATNGEFVLNGVLYQLPSSPQVLMDNGWKFTEEEIAGFEVPAENITTRDIKLHANTNYDLEIGVRFENKSKGTKPAEDCDLYEITIKSVENGNTVVLPKGISFASGYEEVVAAYGEPTVNYLDQTGFIVYMDGENNTRLTITFAQDHKSIKEIKIA